MHRLASLKPARIVRLGRAFSNSRPARNLAHSSTTTTPDASLPEVYQRSDDIAPVFRRREHKVSAALLELSENVQALEAIAGEESPAIVHETTYTEEELASFYQDVLANPLQNEAELKVNQKLLAQARNAQDAAIVDALYERFDVDNAASTSQRPYLTIISRLDSIVSRLDEADRLASPEGATLEQQTFPIGILTPRECEALVRVSIKSQDNRSAERVLELMKRTGLQVPEESITDLLKLYASSGDAQAADNLLARYVTGPPAEDHRHFHIAAHLKATPPQILPTAALDVLHTYENQSTPAPIRTYTAVITSLFSLPSALAHAQAWDLFSHMRYVAHPDPDALMYTLMIRACASPIQTSLRSEPEKALDLWHEMTIDHKLTPTLGAYNAVILACARAGTKQFVNEAFRIARQMMDSHRDAEGFSPYRPDRKTFAALLEGAKRIGDLARVRHILAEMTRRQEEIEPFTGPSTTDVDEEIMLHVFNAYAAYDPPFLRAATKVVDPSSVEKPAKAPADTSAPETQEDSTSPSPGDVEVRRTPSFAHIPPQTHSEVVQEAEFLFQSIRDAQSNSERAFSPSLVAAQKFRHVAITPRLVNAYISVLYNHASLRTCREAFNTLYSELDITRSVKSYIEALERCANSKKKRDGGWERELALAWGEELWKEWKVIEEAGQFNGRRLDSRLIERANTAMIRIYTLNHQLDQALDIVRTFVARYPSQALSKPPPKPTIRSTRTVLVGAKPLVRMTGAADVPDDFVPPFLGFKDVEVLHHRLVAYERGKDIGYLKWVVKSYEWALRVRRDNATKHIPAKDGETRAVIPTRG